MGKWLYRLHVELLLVPPIEFPLGLHDGSPWWFLVVLGLFNNHAEFRIALSIFKPTPNTPPCIPGCNIQEKPPIVLSDLFSNTKPFWVMTKGHHQLMDLLYNYLSVCVFWLMQNISPASLGCQSSHFWYPHTQCRQNLWVSAAHALSSV